MNFFSEEEVCDWGYVVDDVLSFILKFVGVVCFWKLFRFCNNVDDWIKYEWIFFEIVFYFLNGRFFFVCKSCFWFNLIFVRVNVKIRDGSEIIVCK